CFSFYPTKNLGAIGDGGAIVTNHKGFAELCRRLRNYGFKERDAQHHWGYNSRLDELQAAVLSARLDSLDQGNIDRLSVGEEYEAGLESVDEVCLVRGGNHHIVGILCRNRSKLKKFLERAGIQTSIHYPIPAYRQLAYQSQFDDAEDLFLAGTESWCEEVLSLPCHPHMDLNEVLYV
ncbi:MAG: hypothetical protein GWN77_11875, partial [Gammaproteobacteria bacterium]|nr:hypothetical protein [Desulfobacterales bacterium]NIR27631.1 hypothetical protein [Gammaproteobacteria bacterium]NIV67869.1 hypothetical protein [Candidatus Bathyarchaeota archaeon]NIW34457.1 hypothetical protein [Candidatus Bathyarchaeota archaeon]